MSSPFNPARDSNAGKGTAFDAEPDVIAMDSSPLHDGLKPVSNHLGEEDYR